MWAFLAPWLAKNFSRFIGVMVYVLIFAGIGWSIYVTVVRPHTKPTPSTTQSAVTIVNNTYNCKALIGWGIGKTLVQPDTRKEPNGNPNSVISGNVVDIPKK